jgi:hypothetical protein
MLKMALRPDSDSYTQAEPAGEVIRTELDGGIGRQRRDKLGASRMIQVQWTMNPTQYAYFRAFLSAVDNGSLPFLIDLVGEYGLGPEEHTAQFMPGTISLPRQVGLTYVQQATLEVRPNPRDRDADMAFIVSYGEWGDDTEAVLLALEELVNVIAPEDIGA